MFDMNRGSRHTLLPIGLMILAGILGNLMASGLALVVPRGPAHEILTFGYGFGINPPWVLDLSVMTLTFGFSLKVTIVGALFMIVVLLLYKKI
ncbi:MAG: hypothetical protein CO150_09300 [Nitrospirae bacterium CG_4_9_14_3_um_filter_53_35]|nr:MAG: hypothetical protein AUK29_07465 [Nitrospirae bacterium CG2_30_53_67]PIS36359.1 MAG: hypothetical protein COT35_11690 [Nitrospirae bacterium CG08_land_8_20_14_0_20_52_24]PIV83243.1 MAG: hypothetical protein COW52_09325 [Nitrospirae bacterium CG17_big_fil_post_rev_8_21_14_2_50_50_9]PIW84804.1 MAG: hypothetical protein COZ95_07770 [Nitrospirae bacterium CG_4_8_14_3_um_filter_50_41]PIX87076.1 MAG: hypothetical protein COZ32_00015 [Nitrospirae bacterium CG_4_10_14_3_um_filter_53_41]PJA7297